MSGKKKRWGLPPLQVSIFEPKPDPVHADWQHAVLRFLIFNRPVACAACGKKKRTLWTMLCHFTAADMDASTVFELKSFPGSFAPLTPVCPTHPLALEGGDPPTPGEHACRSAARST